MRAAAGQRFQRAGHPEAAVDQHQVGVGGGRIVPDRLVVARPCRLHRTVAREAEFADRTDVHAMQPQATGLFCGGDLRFDAQALDPARVAFHRPDPPQRRAAHRQQGAAAAAEFDQAGRLDRKSVV